jgi:hypothetical protein
MTVKVRKGISYNTNAGRCNSNPDCIPKQMQLGHCFITTADGVAALHNLQAQVLIILRISWKKQMENR